MTNAGSAVPPPVGVAEGSAFVVPCGGLLAVHAHPDDETLATGALLATWAAAGLPVTVVTCTRGERGETIGDALAHLEGDGAALAAHREGELVAAVRALGVGEQVFLDRLPLPSDGLAPGATPHYEDSGMAWVEGTSGVARASGTVPARAFERVPVDEAAARLAALVLRERPSAVVTYEPGGGYGHPDHVRAHAVTVRALELAAPQHRPRHVWWRVETPDGHRAALEAVRRRATTAGGPGHRQQLHLPVGTQPSPSQVSATLSVDVVVDLAPVLDTVVAALRAHRSQVQAVEVWAEVGTDGGTVLGTYALSNGELAALPRYERYHEVMDGGAGVEVPTPRGDR